MCAYIYTYIYMTDSENLQDRIVHNIILTTLFTTLCYALLRFAAPKKAASSALYSALLRFTTLYYSFLLVLLLLLLLLLILLLIPTSPSSSSSRCVSLLLPVLLLRRCEQRMRDDKRKGSGKGLRQEGSSKAKKFDYAFHYVLLRFTTLYYALLPKNFTTLYYALLRLKMLGHNKVNVKQKNRAGGF